MPIVTANQIKRVGNRMEFRPHHFRHPVPYPIRMNGLGDVVQGSVNTAAAGACVAANMAGPAEATLGISLVTCLPSLIKAFISWLTNPAGQYKISATQFAEGIVRLCYGLDPDCALPPGGIPIVPGANPPRFCANSVAGMIERCSLTNASITLQRAEQLMQQKLSVANDPVTPYVQRWYTQYGTATFSDLHSHLSAAQSQCAALGISSTAGSNPTYPPIYTGGTTNYTPYLILGGIALFGVFMMNR